MRSSFVCPMMSHTANGANRRQYTLKRLAQNGHYASVVKRIDGLRGTYADGARKYLPAAIKAGETMLSSEQTARLCNQVFSHLRLDAFGALQKFPDIFKAAQERMDPNHVIEIIEKLARECRSSLPFYELAPFIEQTEGFSSKEKIVLINMVINPDKWLTCRLLKFFPPALRAVRRQVSSNDNAVKVFQLLRSKCGILHFEEALKSLPSFMQGVTCMQNPEDIAEHFEAVKDSRPPPTRVCRTCSR